MESGKNWEVIQEGLNFLGIWEDGLKGLVLLRAQSWLSLHGVSSC